MSSLLATSAAATLGRLFGMVSRSPHCVNISKLRNHLAKLTSATPDPDPRIREIETARIALTAAALRLTVLLNPASAWHKASDE